MEPPSSGIPRPPASTPSTGSGGAPTTYRSGGTISTNRDIAKVQADYLALANDLEQAQALSSTLEIQLSGKTNELARFKAIWERAQADLAKFAQDLDAMRKERHSLANEAQRGYAFELKLTKLQAAHDALTTRAERLEAELAQERAKQAQVREELDAPRGRPVGRPLGSNPASQPDAQLREALETLRTQLDRVLAAPASSAGSQLAPAAKAAAPEHIEIHFSA